MFDENPNEQLSEQAKEQASGPGSTCLSPPACLFCHRSLSLSARRGAAPLKCSPPGPPRRPQDFRQRLERVLEVVVPFVFHSCETKKPQQPGGAPALAAAGVRPGRPHSHLPPAAPPARRAAGPD